MEQREKLKGDGQISKNALTTTLPYYLVALYLDKQLPQTLFLFSIPI